MNSQTAATVTSPQDTAAITALVGSLNDAWNRGDAHAFSVHYAPDGSFTNILGMTLYGREGFEKQHNTIFTTIYKGSHNTLTVDHVKLIRPDVAIVDVTSRLGNVAHFPPGIQPAPDGTITTRLQLVLTREPGQDSQPWQIAAFHNVAVIPLPPRP